MSKTIRSIVRTLLHLSLALLVAAPAVATESHGARLQDALTQLSNRARPGVLGVAVIDLHTGARMQINADRAYPMMSVFKAPVAAVVLAQIDNGRLTLSQEVNIDRRDIVNGAAVPSIGAHFKGERMAFTVKQLLVAAVSESDNTAVDALIRVVGGPLVVTDFLHAHGIYGMSIDLNEAQVDRIFQNTANGQSIPERETEQAEVARRRRGYCAFLSDPRNRTTPDAAANFLQKLWTGQLLSARSTKQLLGLMYDQTVPSRMRAGLSHGVRFADKCGTSYSMEGVTAAFNDIGIMTSPNGHTIIVAAFLTASRADKQTRNALFAEIGKSVAGSFRPAH
jgi:beta-lactamase class A